MVKLILVRVGTCHVPVRCGRQGPEIQVAVSLRQDQVCKTYVLLS